MATIPKSFVAEAPRSFVAESAPVIPGTEKTGLPGVPLSGGARVEKLPALGAADLLPAGVSVLSFTVGKGTVSSLLGMGASLEPLGSSMERDARAAGKRGLVGGPVKLGEAIRGWKDAVDEATIEPLRAYQGKSFDTHPELARDPVYITSVVGQALGSLAAFLVPGKAAGKLGAETIATLAPKLLAARPVLGRAAQAVAGSGAGSALESVVNATDNYARARTEYGAEEGAALLVFAKTLDKDLPVTGVTNLLGLYSPKVGPLWARALHRLADAGLEGFQEVKQGDVAQEALREVLGDRVPAERGGRAEDFVGGAGSGLIASLAGALPGKVRGSVRSPEVRTEPAAEPTREQIREDAAAIDTGGARVGTAAAAQNVAQRKLREGARAWIARSGRETVTITDLVQGLEVAPREARALLDGLAEEGALRRRMAGKRPLYDTPSFAEAPAGTPGVGKLAEAVAPESFAEEPAFAEASAGKVQTSAKLPRGLAGAKPRYRSSELVFEDDLDRAAYITAQAKRSKRDADYVAWVAKQTGWREAEIRRLGARVRRAIGTLEEIAPGIVRVPPVLRPLREAQAAPVPPAAEKAPAATEPESQKARKADRAPSRPPAYGRETAIAVPGEQTKYPARYAVRELADVQASHLEDSFEPNPRFEFTNDRDYRQPGNAARVIENANPAQFDPDFLLTDAPTAEHGATIIDPRGNALGGNNRRMTLGRLYQFHPEAAARYRERLEAKAAEFGIDPAQVARFAQPVLVRERSEQPADAQREITDFNKVAAAKLNPGEQAVTDGRRLSERTIGRIVDRLEDAGEGGSLADALRGDNGAEVIQSLVADGVITDQEKNAYIDEQENLTAEGKARIAKALVGRMFATAEQWNQTPPAMRGKLEKIAPHVARVEARAEWRLSDTVREAVDLLGEAKAHGAKNLGDLARQAEIGGREYSAEAVAVAEALRQSPNQAAAAFRRFANDEALSREGAQQAFFTPPTRAEAFADAFGAREAPRKLAPLPVFQRRRLEAMRRAMDPLPAGTRLSREDGAQPYNPSETVAALLGRVRFRRMSVPGSSVPVVLANLPGLDVLNAVITTRRESALDIGGAFYEPWLVRAAADRLGEAGGGTLSDLLREGSASGLILVRDHPALSDADILSAVMEELAHREQARLSRTGSPLDHLQDTAGVLEGEAGRTVSRALREAGYSEFPEGSRRFEQQVVVEAGARLMHAVRHEELGLSERDARRFAARYMRALRREHGSQNAREIAGAIAAAFRERSAAARRGPGSGGQHSPGGGGDGPQGRGGPAGRAGPDLSGDEPDGGSGVSQKRVPPQLPSASQSRKRLPGVDDPQREPPRQTHQADLREASAGSGGKPSSAGGTQTSIPLEEQPDNAAALARERLTAGFDAALTPEEKHRRLKRRPPAQAGLFGEETREPETGDLFGPGSGSIYLGSGLGGLQAWFDRRPNRLDLLNPRTLARRLNRSKIKQSREFFLAVETRMNRQGQGSGQALMDAITRAEDMGAVSAGQRLVQLMDAQLDRLSDAEAWQGPNSLRRVLEGLGQPGSARVDTAAAASRRVTEEIGDEAEMLDVHVQMGTRRVPFGEARIANYFPHHIPGAEALESGPIRGDVLERMVLDGEARDRAEAAALLDEWLDYLDSGARTRRLISHLVASGKASDEADAEAKLRRQRAQSKTAKHGNLEFAREVDLPFWDPDPRRVLPAHAVSASMRLAQVAEVGQSDAVINRLIKTSSDLGGNARFMDKAVQAMLGREQEQDEAGEWLARTLRTIQAYKLTLAGIPNGTQGVYNTAIKTKSLSVIMAGLRGQFSREGKRFALQAGVTIDSVLHESVRDLAMTSRQLDLFLRANGFSATERGNRVFAANAGAKYAELMLGRLRRNARHGKARAALEELGIDAGQARARGHLTAQEVLLAAKKFTDLTQFRSRPQDMPFFARTPWGKVFFQFKNFVYNQGRFLKREIVDEWRAGRPGEAMKAVAIAGLLGAGLGEGVRALRNLITGREQEFESLWERLWADWAAMATLGMFADTIERAGTYQGLLRYIVGPGIEFVGDSGAFLYALGSAARQGDGEKAEKAAKRYIGRHAPGGTLIKRLWEGVEPQAR